MFLNGQFVRCCCQAVIGSCRYWLCDSDILHKKYDLANLRVWYSFSNKCVERSVRVFFKSCNKRLIQQDLCQSCLAFPLALISKCWFLAVSELCLELLVETQFAAISAWTRSGIGVSSGYILQLLFLSLFFSVLYVPLLEQFWHTHCGMMMMMMMPWAVHKYRSLLSHF
jgi:hypothetical protein